MAEFHDMPSANGADAAVPPGSQPGSALVRRGVGRTLFAMAFPLLAGTVAMNAYSLTDTWFVARLGTLPLAAMGFAFPVVMLLTSVAAGIGTAVTALASHALGRDDHARAAALVTHGLALVLGVAAVLAAAGSALMVPIFARLGADARVQPLVAAYMHTWYAGAVFMALPMLGNGILIASGDSRAASGLMLLGPLLNVILDPIMIFGWLGCPAMGIRGAALATVIAQAAAALWMVRLLAVRHRLLAWRRGAWRGWLSSARRLLAFAVPTVLNMILMPVSATVITRVVSRFGHAAVAAVSAAQRLEMFAFVIPMALGISLTPFVSQNFGAARVDRVQAGFRLAAGFALLYGGLAAALFIAGARWLAALFTADPAVAGPLAAYIRIVSLGYGMMEIHRYCGFVLTGMHRPASTTLLNVVRVGVFLIPLSLLGAEGWGLRGVFAGRLAADLAAGSLGLLWVARVLKAVAGRRAPGGGLGAAR